MPCLLCTPPLWAQGRQGVGRPGRPSAVRLAVPLPGLYRGDDRKALSLLTALGFQMVDPEAV